jgi:hypothetical protein
MRRRWHDLPLRACATGHTLSALFPFEHVLSAIRYTLMSPIKDAATAPVRRLRSRALLAASRLAIVARL